jgi:hypothetical protein
LDLNEKKPHTESDLINPADGVELSTVSVRS